MYSMFFWEFPRRLKYKSFYTSEAGEIPKRT